MKPLTPLEIVAEIDRRIVGQERAKRAVAVAIRNRWRREKASVCDLEDSASYRYLVTGPRGVGKSETIRRAAQVIDAPFVRVSAFQLASESSADSAARSVLESLVENATCKLSPDSLDLAAREVERAGIILIDDLDRWLTSSTEDAGDDLLETVQQSLYRLASSPRINTRYGTLSTRHMLMFATGRITSGRSADMPHDLQVLFPGRVELDPLVEDDLLRLLSHPTSSPIGDYVGLLATEGVKLHFTTDALEVIAAEAGYQNRRIDDIGARRLASVIELVLDDLLYDPSAAQRPELTIDAAYVTGRLAIEGEDDDLDDFIL